MTTGTDITLMGGGVIGLLTARAFYQAGVSVTLLDRGAFGQESSWAGGGMLLPMYPWRQHKAITRLVTHSIQLYPDLAFELHQETGINPEWNPCGVLITQNLDLMDALNWCNLQKIVYQEAENAILQGLDTTFTNPLFLPYIAQIRNPRLTKALKQDLLNKGVKLLENCQVNEIKLNNGRRIEAIETSQGSFMTNELIITAGAWTTNLLAELLPSIRSFQPDIKPVKGQMVMYAAKPNTLSKMVLDGEHYLIPRLDGHILAGSTVEDDSFDKTTTAEAKGKLSHFALRLLPALKDFPLINHWAGIRPGTTNGVPYISRHPEIENLSINAGHFRNGLAMAPASAQLMVDLILNRPTSVDPEPYSLKRLL